MLLYTLPIFFGRDKNVHNNGCKAGSHNNGGDKATYGLQICGQWPIKKNCGIDAGSLLDRSASRQSGL